MFSEERNKISVRRITMYILIKYLIETTRNRKRIKIF